ncbi:MAG TPA: iron-containing alcohol dehydrogenase [bacterium (Candidatus Stahlbacteria)]|nr:iron-containing alcohol dehydrogenase [Candidatus Stahlbacteria bacterium]
MEVLVPVLLRNLDIPVFIEIDHNLIGRIDEILLNYHLKFSKPIFLYGRTTFQIGAQEAMGHFPKSDGILIEKSDEDEVLKVSRKIAEGMHDVVIGIGGGRVLDVGKLASARSNIGFISVPTIPSNDGIASPVAVIKGGGENHSIRARIPMGIIVDIEVLKDAPLRHLKAGAGDLIANLSAVHDWRLAFEEDKDYYDPFAAMLSRLAVETVLNFNDPDFGNPEFLRNLVMGLVLSGIAMGIAGSSRPASGSEHEISHALDHLFGGPGLHGEQVAITTLFSLQLQNQHLGEVQEFYKRLSLPDSIDEVNLSIEDFVAAVQYAPKTRPDRYTILEHLNLNQERVKDVAVKSGIWSGSHQ